MRWCEIVEFRRVKGEEGSDFEKEERGAVCSLPRVLKYYLSALVGFGRENKRGPLKLGVLGQ